MLLKSEMEKFEEKLKSIVNEKIIKLSLDDEYLEEMLEKAGEVELSDLFYNHLLESAKKAMQRRSFIKKKLSSPEHANSLGEYLKYFREINDCSISKVSDLTNIEANTLKKIEYDVIDLTKIPITVISNLIQLLKISVNDAMVLLEKSFSLFVMSKKGITGESFSRVSREVRDAEQDNLLDSALKELLLKVESDKKESKVEQLSFEFKESLKRELKERGYCV